MILVKVLKENEYLEEYFENFEKAMLYVSDLAKNYTEYWSARVYEGNMCFFYCNRFIFKYRIDLLPAEFNFSNQEKKIKLIIKKIKDENLIIDAWLNDEQIANNTISSVDFYNRYPERAYLKFKSIKGKDTMMCICDLKNESNNREANYIKNNRKISNTIFELGICTNLLFPFSMYHPTVRMFR